jgi:hypothetical protein
MLLSNNRIQAEPQSTYPTENSMLVFDIGMHKGEDSQANPILSATALSGFRMPANPTLIKF